jgi:hypothetical protein
MSAKRLIVTETTGAEKDRITVTETEDVEKCDVSTASAQRDTVIKDTDKGFVRTMASAQQRRSLMVQYPSTGTIGLAWSPSTFQPPAHCLDCVLGVASQDCSFRNITPRSCEVCRSTDYALQSTDCTSFSTDCQKGLPDKTVLPDLALLPEDKTVFLASWGEDIVGSVRRRPGSLLLDAAVTRKEVVGLHACQLQSAHSGPD